MPRYSPKRRSEQHLFSRPARYIALLFVAATAITGIAVTPVEPAVAETTREQLIEQAGPLGPITVLGDSVMLGSMLYSPTIGDQLHAYGWGPVRSRSGEGYSTGNFPVPPRFKVTTWIDQWRSEGWDPRDVVINLGANDSGFCQTDLICARESIMHVVDALGPGHRIWWPMITRLPYPYLDQQLNWNQALREIAAERDDFFTWDWPTVMREGPFPSHDFTHLSPSGYRLRSQLMAIEVTSEMGWASKTGGDAPLPTATGSSSDFVPIPTTRVLDTRVDLPGRLDAGSRVVVDVSGIVPEGADAVAAYISATDAAAPGFLTAYRCSDGRPDASNVNYGVFQARGSVTIAPLDPDGTFCVFTRAEADVLVDVQGAFVPSELGDPNGLRFAPLATPQRLIDTRGLAAQDIVTIDVPDGAAAVAVNITAIDGDNPGFLVAYPCSATVPRSATINHMPGDVIAGAAFVPVSEDGTICIWMKSPIDIAVDLTGTFAPGAGLAFVASSPTRMIDTRSGIGGWSPLHGQRQTIDAAVAPAGARAVSGTLTIAFPLRPGYLRASGCGTQAETSTVNSADGSTLANFLTTGINADGRLCVFSRGVTSTLFDTTGWWIDAPPSPVDPPSATE